MNVLVMFGKCVGGFVLVFLCFVFVIIVFFFVCVVFYDVCGVVCGVMVLFVVGC